MKKLLAIILCLSALNTFAQSDSKTLSFRVTTPISNPTDSVIFTFSGKPDGYSSLYTGLKVRNLISGLGSLYKLRNDSTATDGYSSIGRLRSASMALYNKTFPQTPTANDMPIRWQDTTIYAKYSGYATPQQYGAIGNGIVDDSDAIIACLAANLNVRLYGTYKVTKKLPIRTNHKIYSDNATISFNNVTKIIFEAIGVNEWQIDGKLLMQGNAYGKTDTVSAIKIKECKGFLIQNVTFKNINGYGFNFLESTDGNPVALRNGTVIDCIASRVGRGINIEEASEYHSIINFKADSCEYGIYKLGGNISIIGGYLLYNEIGLYSGGAANNTHGIITGLHSNHNTVHNLYVNGSTLGETYTACHFYGDATAGVLINDSYGVNFDNCVFDGKLELTGGASDFNHLFNCFLDLNFAPVSNPLIRYVNCVNIYGGFYSGNSLFQDVNNNVGIGTVTPTNITGYKSVTLNGSNGGILDFKTGNTLFASIISDASGLQAYTTGARAFILGVNNAEKGRISPGGNFLWKTTTDTGEDVQINGTQKVVGAITNSALTASQLVATDADKKLVSVTDLPSGTTASTPSGSTEVANKAYVDAKVEDNLTASTNVAPSKTAVINALATKQDALAGTTSQIVLGNGSATTVLPSGITATTQSAGTNDNTVATTSFVNTAIATFVSGQYTPTITNGTNVTANTPLVCNYFRVGNIVTVSGLVSLTTNASSAYSAVNISLPVASNLGASTDLSGVGQCEAGDSNPTNITLSGNTGSDVATLDFTSSATTSDVPVIHFTFTYKVI